MLSAIELQPATAVNVVPPSFSSWCASFPLALRACSQQLATGSACSDLDSFPPWHVFVAAPRSFLWHVDFSPRHFLFHLFRCAFNKSESSAVGSDFVSVTHHNRLYYIMQMNSQISELITYITVWIGHLEKVNCMKTMRQWLDSFRLALFPLRDHQWFWHFDEVEWSRNNPSYQCFHKSLVTHAKLSFISNFSALKEWFMSMENSKRRRFDGRTNLTK